MTISKKNVRRAFLNKGLKWGLFSIVSGGVVKSIAKSHDPSETDKVELLTPDGDLIEIEASAVEEIPATNNYDDDYNVREGMIGRKIIMVIDLARCKNARKCVSVCNKMHYLTGPNSWLKVYKRQDSKLNAPYWQPTTCQHCDRPPCVKVCPVDATFKRRDGIVLIDNERCIGCRFCMAACPYSIRVFNWGDPQQGEEVRQIPYSPETSVPARKGTVGKCDFCPDMLRKGELPHCVRACPNGVFFFGDQYEDTVTNGDETFRLSKLLQQHSGYRMWEDLGTEPSVYYLPPANRITDFEKGLDNYNEEGHPDEFYKPGN